MSARDPRSFFDEANRLASSGKMEEALALLAQGRAEYPEHADLANGLGAFQLRAGRKIEAAESFAKACTLDPSRSEFQLNHAIALNATSDHRRALEVLERLETTLATDVRYASARGTAERGCGNLLAARQWFETALQCKPDHAVAAHGLARCALEQGDAQASELFRAAIAMAPGDPEMILAYAEALHGEGDRGQARQVAEELARRFPAWSDGLRLLAQIKLAAGEDFSDVYRAAQLQQPTNPAIARAHWQQLFSTDRFAEAADVAGEATRQFPDAEGFALLEATASSAALQLERADRLFAGLTGSGIDRTIHEARHWYRKRDFQRSAAALEGVIEQDRDNFSAWALLGLVWRELDDPRDDWLHGQKGLVTQLEVVLEGATWAEVEQELDAIHANASFPLGQSLRGGTQTRGRLFDRPSEPIQKLREGIAATVERYRDNLPPEDPDHPILSRRNRPLALAGSWSVRFLEGSSRHESHIHPEGLVSSACYIRAPEGGGGELELGRPPPDLNSNLPPERVFEPKERHLALFPSTLYHGTRPFDGAKRMTVAFDVVSGL
ncbi:tetratricopeptide repeat protein [Qipengyuania aurantiaca]|uniref:Tetratricopeptide repeat protein n=1 Tax=Qipengyuania aurantiaca TaxID=2867233 RepID=A0ABX8ZMI5_9SPHN|nr:tetratricopeptide repeat protein [Qipengyuania aurantiaca]QZD90197.1 tetratricopeptide repeat protein [Qipengyuania aurantiaca]